MARKKKAKGSKLARMNDEERARYMQHRAEFELETRRRKQQLIAIFTKNKLKHEGAFSKLNTAKVNEKWRYVLRQIKCKELHENVTHLCTSFDRVIQIKDATISYLYEELNTADKDHRKLQENHIASINNIIGKYKQKLQELQDMYKFDDITTNNIIELARLKYCTEQSYKEISNSTTRRNSVFNESFTTRKTQNAVNIFTVLYLEKDMASDLVRQSFLKIDYTWDQLHEVLNEYEAVIENKKKQHDYLKEQDDIYQMSMLQYPKEHLHLQNVIQSLKHNIEILSLKRGERIAKLKTNDASLKQTLKKMKHEFTTNQAIDISQLKQLTASSNKVLKHLQAIVEKGATIQELIKTCSNLEPFFNLRKYFMQDAVHADITDSNIPESCSKVNNFWEHYNEMRVNNILLKKECYKLCAENKKLKYKFQSYLTLDLGMLALYPVESPLI